MIFKPEDFKPHEGLPQVENIHVDIAAELANAKFEAWLKEQPMVFSFKNPFAGTVWYPSFVDSDTHQARLVCIEELEEK